jgi:superoxide dismutase
MQPEESAAGASLVAPPASGLMATRIGQEFGSAAEFVNALERALARGGGRGATILADIEGDRLSIHLPRTDGPSWNTVPLIHVRRGEPITADAWADANAILEKLERSR